MSTKKDRSNVRIEINDLLDRHCKPCEIKGKFTSKYKDATGHLANYCKRRCPKGKQLIELGNKLNTGRKPKSVLDHKIKVEKEKKPMKSEDVETKKVKSVLTKEIYLEEHKTKSNAQIEKDWGMKYNTLYPKLKAWGLTGKPKDEIKVEVSETNEKPDPNKEYREVIQSLKNYAPEGLMTEALKTETVSAPSRLIEQPDEFTADMIEKNKGYLEDTVEKLKVNIPIGEMVIPANVNPAPYRNRRNLWVEVKGNEAVVEDELLALLNYVQKIKSGNFKLEIHLVELV